MGIFAGSNLHKSEIDEQIAQIDRRCKHDFEDEGRLFFGVAFAKGRGGCVGDGGLKSLAQLTHEEGISLPIQGLDQDDLGERSTFLNAINGGGRAFFFGIKGAKFDTFRDQPTAEFWGRCKHGFEDDLRRVCAMLEAEQWIGEMFLLFCDALAQGFDEQWVSIPIIRLKEDQFDPAVLCALYTIRLEGRGHRKSLRVMGVIY